MMSDTLQARPNCTAVLAMLPLTFLPSASSLPSPSPVPLLNSLPLPAVTSQLPPNCFLSLASSASASSHLPAVLNPKELHLEDLVFRIPIVV